MPAVAARAGRRRRGINEINMVPFIDVMLVLLIIFMVSAPLITTGVVDLPSVGQAKQRPQSVIEIEVRADGTLTMKRDGQTEGSGLQPAQIASRVKAAQGGDPQTPVVISADKNVKYETVVNVMDRLQRADVPRVGLAVRQGG